MNETTTTRLGDIAEQIDSISATIFAVSDGIRDLHVSKSLVFLTDLLDQAVEDIYAACKENEDGTR